MVVQLTFYFKVQLLRSIYQKNAKAMEIILVQESYKLTQAMPRLDMNIMPQVELGSCVSPFPFLLRAGPRGLLLFHTKC